MADPGLARDCFIRLVYLVVPLALVGPASLIHELTRQTVDALIRTTGQGLLDCCATIDSGA